ncbi:MAG TPA: cytochrome c oxidase assembly protein [Terriglobales bacterium]|jgi:putative membrane protein|nr:cytochrome c oxidase assembly protein [Terriglobales bacterium]
MPHPHHVAYGSQTLLALIIAFTAVLYLRGWLRLRSTSLKVIPVWRAGSFLLGMSLIWTAVASPLAALDHELLTVHMLQHLLLMTIAPPLIWLGAPFMMLLHGLPRPFEHIVIRPLLRLAPVETAGRMLTQPALCWLAAAAALVGWHIPALFTLGLQSAGWHLAEYASFLATGLLFWWPVIQPWPSASKWPGLSIILYLFLATLPCDILSGFLVFCDRVVYAMYFSSSHPFGLSALEDQQCAGALMWTCVTVVYLVAGAILTAKSLSPLSFREAPLVQSELRPDALPQRAPQSLEAV